MSVRRRPEPDSAHRRDMNRYYSVQARIYDPTRWMFLFDRQQIVDDLGLAPGDRVLEIGCGTGSNLDFVRRAVGGGGEVLGVDCAVSMLGRARERIRRHGWANVSVTEEEYGRQPVRPGWASAVLFSYSLSMIPAWTDALDCARLELGPGGRVGVVDFCYERDSLAARLSARWFASNHVDVRRPYLAALEDRFHTRCRASGLGWRGLWTWFRFVGELGEQP